MSTRVKQPNESLLYAMDFVNLLATGDSLASITSVTDTPTGELTITGEVIAGTTVTFTVADGTDQTTYHIEVIVVTANGETLEGDGYLYVTDTPEYELTFSYSYSNLKVAIADFMGWGRNTEGTGTAWSSTDESRMDAIIKSALTQVYFPAGGHQWSWMRPSSQITTSAPYSTGTLTVVSGVVTLAGGTFPSWAASGDIEFDGETYTIATRDGNTQITLSDTSVDADALTTYTLSRYRYDLPADFLGYEGQMTYRASQSELYGPIEYVSDLMIRRWRQQHTYTDRPTKVAMRPKSFDADTGQAWEAVFYPTPNDAYVLDYRYRVRPTMLNEAYPNPMGGPDIGELILESCLALAEQRYKDELGLHTQAFQAKLAAAIEHDRRAFVPDTLGYNGDHSDGVRTDRFDGVAIHSFNGTIYYD